MSAHAHADAALATGDLKQVPADKAKRLLTIGGALAVVGLALAGAGAASDTKRFAFAWLAGFYFVLTIGLGGLMFVLIQHVTKAGWSVAARRPMEWLAGLLPICLVLFLPILALASQIYHPWWDAAEAAKDEMVHGKHAYLNHTFFYIRIVIYFAIWIGLSTWFRTRSRAQDESGDPNHTFKMQFWSAPSILLGALSLTFAGFDWLMSLDPRWYSTIFGVYLFAGSMVSSLGVLALFTLWCQTNGWLKKVSTVEHRHDIGKLLFGFTVFWAYIAFSQFFLIWYANIPEETMFFFHRWHGGWGWISLSLPILHFAVPFMVLLSRTAKRTPALLATGAVLLLVMHYVDMFWLVMPNYNHEEVPFGITELGAMLAPIGVLVAWIGYRASKDNLYPIRDPRLAETMRVDNP